ncbi:PAQR family membrane homeostasis protein TrhA [Roseateles sp.]|uniref:PAQR family membrane homeostasis protein TrhA n=1 Tax=Roseateles sp. TaxID=1971397 RepID=UPI003BAC410E
MLPLRSTHSAPPADRDQTLGEEIANAISHGLGVVLAIAALPILVIRAMHHGAAADVAAAAVFAATMILLYGVSTLYHALPSSLWQGRAKALLLRMDHAAIYVFIAGSYTPFTLGVLHTGPGVTLLIAVWAAAAFGVAIKLLNRLRHRLVSTGLYLAMGWVVVFAAGPLMANVPATGLALLVAGGLSYTLGAFVFLLDNRVKYSHFVWHLFVLGGSVCHFFAALWYAYG